MKSMTTVLRCMKKELKKFKFSEQNDLPPNHLWLLKKRFEKRCLRGYFAWQTAVYLNEKKSGELPFLQQLPFVLEVTMTILYYQNHLLDSKHGAMNPKHARRTQTDYFRLLQHLHQYICAVFPDEDAARITASIDRILALVNEGQRLEVDFNTYESYLQLKTKRRPVFSRAAQQIMNMKIIDRYESMILELLPRAGKKAHFLRIYLERIYLTNAAFYVETVRLIGDLLGKNNPELLKPLEEFAAGFGILKQIINDTADFVPAAFTKGTSTKMPEDVFNDLQNKIITLPLFHYLTTKKRGLVFNVLKIDESSKSPFSALLQLDLLEDMLETGSIGFSRNIVERAATHLKEQAGQQHPEFANMCQVAYYNTFYKVYDHFERPKA